MKPFFGAQVLIATCFLCSAAIGQVMISNGVTVSENFDTIGTASTTLTDNTAPFAGFYTLRSAANVAPKPLVAGNGSVSTSQFYNFGSTGNPNRAVGWVNGNGVTSSLGLRLRNNGTTPISSLRIQFAGEQWRDGNGSAEVMLFSYQVGASVTSLSAGTYTNLPAFTFTSPNAVGGANAWDGDLSTNRVAFDQTVAITIPVGEEIMLRWSSLGASAQGDGIGVDDIAITAVGPTAGEASISGRVTTATGIAIRGAYITVQGLDGTLKTTITNSFGFFNLTGLDVGETYVVSVSARRYTFENSSITVNLTDNFTGLNFVAVQ